MASLHCLAGEANLKLDNLSTRFEVMHKMMEQLQDSKADKEIVQEVRETCATVSNTLSSMQEKLGAIADVLTMQANNFAFAIYDSATWLCD